MNGASHLIKRNGTYYFQRRVPLQVSEALQNALPERLASLSQDILDYFGERVLVRLSLRTKDKREAVRLCNQEDFRFNSLQSKVEQWAATGRTTYDTVSDETVKAIAQLWLSRTLEGDEQRRIEGRPREEFLAEEHGLDEMLDDLREALVHSGQRHPILAKIADSLLKDFSLSLEGVKKTIKTGEERRIPLHPDLVKLGFPDYLDRLKKAKADRLFPAVRVKKGNPYEVLGEMFTQFLKDCDLYDDQAPPGRNVLGAYVMRKTFITQARNQGVVSREITGHSDGTTTAIQDRHYIFGPEPFGRKLTELKKFSLPVVIPVRGID